MFTIGADCPTLIHIKLVVSGHHCRLLLSLQFTAISILSIDLDQVVPVRSTLKLSGATGDANVR